MAGENALEFPSDAPGSTWTSSSSQMNSPSPNSRPGSSRQGDRRRSLLVRDDVMLNKKPLYRQSVDYTEYEATPLNGQPQSNLSLRRHSTYSCNSSSSSGDSRPSSASRKATRDIHPPRTSTWQTSTPREHLQRRQTTCLPSTANSYSEDSADDTSPRQLFNKSTLSKYKPLPAIRGKNNRTSSPEVFRIPTDSQTEDTAPYTANHSSLLPSPKSLPVGIKRESSLLSDKDHPRADEALLDVRLDLKGSSPEPIQDEDVRLDRKTPSPQLIQPGENPELLSAPICPTNSMTSPSELPGMTDLPKEPGPEEARTELAVKLPNGQRIQRFFCLTDPLRLVRRFAEVSSNADFSNFQLVKSVPRDILDLERTIEENQVVGKMLLHLEMTPQN